MDLIAPNEDLRTSSHQESKTKLTVRENANTRFEETEGSYEIQLPWKNNCNPTSDGYMMCSRHSFQLHSRLKKDEPILREYDQTVCPQIESGIKE